MKHLFYFNTCFNGLFLGMLIDEAIALKEKGDEVLFVYCGGVNLMCIHNKQGSKSLCKFCSKKTKQLLDYYKLENQPLTYYLKSNKEASFHYSNAEEIKGIQYRDVNIGLGIISSYITRTRNLNPNIDVKSRSYFDKHLNQNVCFVDSLYRAIEDFHPDAVHSFNGRFEEMRPVYDICHSLGIKCNLYEGFKKDGEWKKVVFVDHLPHDIKYWVGLRDYSWERYNMTEEEKIELGNSFFQRRRNGVYAGDKIYVKDQVVGNIPPIDKNKINIGLFNSSEDEFSAVGAEWESLKLFKNQYDGIVFMLEHADEKIHFFLRIHPNLKNVPYKYHTDLLSLQNRYQNVTVIPGNSDISTYSLLDQMDKVVCFGSTMGIESAYWKIPTILLGPSLYYYDGICYIPKTNDELLELLKSPIKPLFNESIIRFGAYIMNKDPLILDDHIINYRPRISTLFGIKYPIYDFEKMFISPRMTALCLAFGRYVYSKDLFCKFEIPLKER